MTINIPSTLSLAVAPAGNQTYTIDTASLPQAGLDYLLNYGLKQSLWDAFAGAEAAYQDAMAEWAKGDKTGPEPTKAAIVDALVSKRLKSIQTGQMGVRNSGDALAREVRALIGKALGSKAWAALAPAERQTKVEACLAGKGTDAARALLATAKANVEAGRAIGGTDLGL